MPLVSVVTPTRNRPAMLREAYESLRRQTLQDFEFIISVNGKNAKSLDEARRIEASDGRVRTLYNPTFNLSQAWNAGLAAATGEMVHFLSDDDILDPLFLETGSRALAENPAIDLVGTDFVAFSSPSESTPVPCLLTVPKGKATANGTPTLGSYCLNFTLFRKSLLREMDLGHGPFDPSFSIHGDEDFFVRLSKSEAKARHICSPLVRYRVHPSQATQTSLAKHFFEHLRVSNSARQQTFREVTAKTIWAANRMTGFLGTKVKRRIGMDIRYDVLPIDLLRYPELRP